MRSKLLLRPNGPKQTGPENNLALQDPLYALRSETQEAFDRAKQLEARWKEIEKEQREVYQVRPALRSPLPGFGSH